MCVCVCDMMIVPPDQLAHKLAHTGLDFNVLFAFTFKYHCKKNLAVSCGVYGLAVSLFRRHQMLSQTKPGT